jgi:hypothetical protein
MFDYLLTIRIPFKVQDDVDARREANSIIKNSDIDIGVSLIEYKLQRLNPGKSPDKVEL